MNKKQVLITAFISLLLFSAMAGQFFSLAEANFMPPLPSLPSIYIRNDGSIDPTAPIQRVGAVYSFTGNIIDHTIEVQRDNIVIDGAGYTLQGNGSGTGIYLTHRSGVTIKNVEIRKFRQGINFFNSSNNDITGNKIATNYIAIAFHSSSNNRIDGNKITGNSMAILLYSSSNYNSIVENTIAKNGEGIWCEGTTPPSNYTSIVRNSITENGGFGILIRASYSNTIVGNKIANNKYGIELYGDNSQKCHIVGNKIANNEQGIVLCTQYNSEFYHNNFINNTQQIRNAMAHTYTYTWDNGYPSGGNYWSDYAGEDTNRDGIGDTPYIINERNQDNYPLINPVIIPEFPVEENPLIPPIQPPTEPPTETPMEAPTEENSTIPPTDPSPEVSGNPPDGEKPTTLPTDPSPTSQLPPSPPFIAMPEEYISYTISRVNGSLWAKIDGTYPLYVSYENFGSDDLSKLDDTSLLVTSDELPMFYPTPPGTTNISVKMNETELNWSNHTKTHPEATHHTAIGDWPMIYCTIHPVPDHFILKIHYEHPIILINGSYTFLYDLNISPYLSPWCNKSTAYFNIRMETNYEDFHVYTTGSEEWNPVNYTLTKENTAEIVSIKIISEYNKPLPGDLAVTFTDAKASSPIEYSYAIIAVIGVAIASVAGYQFLKRIDMRFNDKHLRARCAAVKTFAAVSVLLFSIVAGTLLIAFGTANPVPPTSTISVTSPQKNKVYAVNNVSLTFSVTTTIHVSPSDPIGKPLIKYYLDGRLRGQFESKPRSRENFSVTLRGLSDGLHWVEVTKTAHWNVIMIGNYTETSSSGMIGFTVDTTHPSISILAPQDHQAYDANDIPLNFIVSEPGTWISYRLDQQAGVRITGNTTLTGLSDGGHSLIVYAKDNAGNQGVSEIFFSISTQQSQPSPTPQPTNPPAQQSGFLGSNLPMEYGCAIIVVTAAAIAAVAGYLFVKRKKSATATEPASPN